MSSPISSSTRWVKDRMAGEREELGLGEKVNIAIKFSKSFVSSTISEGGTEEGKELQEESRIERR